MSRNDFLFKYWRHYLALEADFIKTTNFVEIDKNNFLRFL